MMWLLFLLPLGLALKEGSKCELITVPVCADSMYNTTMLPNVLGITTQDNVQLEIDYFAPLIKMKCSKKIKFFICSVFVPMCSPTLNRGITACRSVCQEVHDSCIQTLNEFGFKWPASLNCSNFPDDVNNGEVCMREPESGGEERVGSGGGGGYEESPYARPPSAVCPPNLVALEPHRCAPLCGKDISFVGAHKEFAEGWMGAWASVCALITLFAVLTCMLDSRRFRFPDRAIIYIALCYNFRAWAYIARLVLGSEQASCATLKTGEKFLITGGLENHACLMIFIVLYYFGMASQVWWVILTLTWYLAARKKWSIEATEALSSYFHLAAWGIPAILTIAVLVLRLVDASELTGICYVGNSDPLALAGFLIGPTGASLALGLLLIAAGFTGLRSVRKDLLHAQAADFSKLERLMARIAVFSFLYFIPSAVLLALYSYHFTLFWPPRPAASPPPNLHVQLYMLQVFMELIVGTTSGIWVFSRKTFLMWQRTLCCLSQAPLKDVPAERTALVYPPHPHQLPLQSTSSYSSGQTNSRKLPHSYHPISSAASRL